MERKETPKIKMICEHLNLSKATVSKAMNGYPHVSQQTRLAVLSYAEEIGYKTHTAAQHGAAQVRRIGIPSRQQMPEAPDYSADYKVLVGFRDEAQMHGMEMVLLPYLTPEFQAGKTLRALIAEQRLDGVLVNGLRMADPYLKQAATAPTPVVLWDLNIPPCDNVASIGYDSLRGAQMAVEKLVELGHKKIGLFNLHPYAQVSYARLHGYRLGIVNAKLPYDPALECWSTLDEEKADETADLMIRRGVTGVICGSDMLAIKLMRELKKRGIRIPQDMSVIGYDNSPLSAISSPPLSTVGQDFHYIGQGACALMVALMEGLPLGNVVLQPSLVLRASTGPASE